MSTTVDTIAIALTVMTGTKFLDYIVTNYWPSRAARKEELELERQRREELRKEKEELKKEATEHKSALKKLEEDHEKLEDEHEKLKDSSGKFQRVEVIPSIDQTLKGQPVMLATTPTVLPPVPVVPLLDAPFAQDGSSDRVRQVIRAEVRREFEAQTQRLRTEVEFLRARLRDVRPPTPLKVLESPKTPDEDG